MNAVIDTKPGGIVERLHDTTRGQIISVEQDVSAILDAIRAERADNDRLRGFRKPETFFPVARIPLALVDVLKAQGLDVLADPDDMFRFLNDPAFAAFRTSTGRV